MYPSNEYEILFDAVAAGDTLRVESYLASGLNVNTQDEQGKTLLMVACGVKTPAASIVASLLAQNANVNARDRSGVTALALAIVGNHPNVCQELLRGGAETNNPLATEESALELARRFNRLEIAQILEGEV